MVSIQGECPVEWCVRHCLTQETNLFLLLVRGAACWRSEERLADGQNSSLLVVRKRLAGGQKSGVLMMVRRAAC